MVKLDLMHGEWMGMRCFLDYNGMAMASLCGVMYGLLEMMIAMEGRLYRPKRMFIMCKVR